MANPRQRRKARSSSYRPVSHSKHAKRNLKKTAPIRGPKVLQEAWDNKKTVRQNYTRLGLAASLDPLTHEALCPSAKRLQSCPGFGRIIRNAAGSVVGVEVDKVEGEDMDDVDSGIDPEVRRQWASGSTRGNNTVIDELERMSAKASTGARQVSRGQIKFLEGLVKKHGGELKAMAGDLKLNPEQRTVGQIRRALSLLDEKIKFWM